MSTDHQADTMLSTRQGLMDAADLKDALAPLRDMVVSALFLISEIPEPLGGEDGRMPYLMERFREPGLYPISRDEAGNTFGILPGSEGEFNEQVVAHADTLFFDRVDLTASLGRIPLPGRSTPPHHLRVVPGLRRLQQGDAIEPVVTLRLGDLSALLSAGIPALTLGVSRREGEADEETETVDLHHSLWVLPS